MKGASSVRSVLGNAVTRVGDAVIRVDGGGKCVAKRSAHLLERDRIEFGQLLELRLKAEGRRAARAADGERAVAQAIAVPISGEKEGLVTRAWRVALKHLSGDGVDARIQAHGPPRDLKWPMSETERE